MQQIKDMNRLQAYFKDFSLLGTRERMSVLAILFFAFAVGVVLTTTVRSASRETTYVPDEAPSTPFVASMTPVDRPSPFLLQTDTAQVYPDQTFRISILLDPGETSIEGADFALRYHPGRVRPVAIEPGDAFRLYPTKEIDGNTIIISARNPIDGNRLIATILMQALATPDVAFITFDPQRTSIMSTVRPTPVDVSKQDVAIRIIPET